jgi:hypothetical protein
MAEWSNALVLKTSVPRGTGGSNPSFSAKTPENQRIALVFLCLNANEACFSERIRHKKAQDAEGELVFRCFGTVPLRDLLSEVKKIPYLELVLFNLQNSEHNIHQPT